MRGKSETSLRGRVQRAYDYCQALVNQGPKQSHFGYPGQTIMDHDRKIVVDDFVKEQIELYVKTWILPDLRAALEKLNKKR